MKRRNLLKGLFGLPLLGLGGKAKELPKPEPVKAVPDNSQCLTACTYTLREWAAPRYELDALDLEIQSLRESRKK